MEADWIKTACRIFSNVFEICKNSSADITSSPDKGFLVFEITTALIAESSSPTDRLFSVVWRALSLDNVDVNNAFNCSKIAYNITKELYPDFTL